MYIQICIYTYVIYITILRLSIEKPVISCCISEIPDLRPET